MAAIRERSPSEITLEKKLLNCVPAAVENSGALFDFFKSRAKEMINYHMDKPKKPRKYMKEDERDGFEESIPVKSSYKKRPQPRKNKENNEVEPSDDYKRLKETVSKRAYVVENVASVLNSQKKALSTIKMTTNREHLLKQVEEVESANEGIVSELETLLLSLHESLRQVDKLAQISAFEKISITKELNVEFQENLNKERKKYEGQIKALQDLNKTLAAIPKAADVEKEFQRKIAELNNKVEIMQRALEDKTDGLKKKQSDFSELLQEIAERNKEIEALDHEKENLKELIKSQEEGFERENAVLKSDIAKLERLVKETHSSQEASLKNELQLSNSSVQAKDRELAKLKMELGNLEEQVRRQNFELDTKQRNIIELREHLQGLQEDKKVQSKNESQEISFLRSSLEEKERQLMTERERISVEIETREKHRIKQKNEWAEIYTGLKHEIKELKQTVADLTEERERRGIHSSIRENELSESQITIRSQNEALKIKLKERDNEIKALWEIVQELQKTDMNKGKIDFNDIKTLIIIKNLEEKAKQRLKRFLN